MAQLVVPPPSSTDLVIPGYRIEERVGLGGMGVVYKATQVALGRRVALKVIQTGLAESDAFRTRFTVEARAAAAVEHPNVLPLYEAGEANGLLFIAMRFVEGYDLNTLLATDGPMTPFRAVDILSQVAAALDAAHSVGVVHRDVKPSNILIETRATREHAFLSDFGVAQYVEADQSMVGTPTYMAPEQIRGESVGPAADVYSLGVVLYTMLAGRPPFEGDTTFAVLNAHLEREPPSLAEADKRLSSFDQVIARALSKTPADRFPTAGELATAAEVAAEQSPPGAWTAPPPETGPPVVSAATPVPAGGWGGTNATVTAPPPPVIDAIRPEELPALEPPPAPAVAPPPPVAVPPPPASAPPPRAEEPRGHIESLLFFEPLHRALHIPLATSFQYIHEPLEPRRDAIRYLGDTDSVTALQERIRRSRGGAFLVTGFRGTGKSTLVRHALDEMTHGVDAPGVLAVTVDVARPTSSEVLLFSIIRRLFDALVDAQVLERLEPEVRQLLVLACTRTSYQLTETKGESRERSVGLGLDGSRSLLAAIAPKLDLSGKRTSSRQMEAAMLPYSVADVEHDFLRLARMLRAARLRRRGPRGRWLRQSQDWQPKIVVVLDELDKLSSESERGHVEELLAGLKNLFTTAGVHFIFVAGPDLHDRVLKTNRRGNSVFESVFGWQLYVPCLWGGGRLLLEQLAVSDDSRLEDRELIADHLEFKARGIPRLLLMELNAIVRWRDELPSIELPASEVARVEFYAGLQRVLEEFLAGDQDGGYLFAIPIDEDRWRLGAYYVTDWILRTRGATFTAEDIADPERGATMDASVRLGESKLTDLLQHLLARDIIIEEADVAERTLIGGTAHASAVYRLSPRVRKLLRVFATASERERADLAPSLTPASPAPAPAAQPWEARDGALLGGRYALEREIGRGAVSRVYRARDQAMGRMVVVKLFEPGPGVDAQELSARFEREARLVRELHHPQFPRTLDIIRDGDRLAIVSDLVTGRSLADLIRSGPVAPAQVVRIAADLADGLAYLAGRGIARIDLKPSNIIDDEDGRPVIIELGLAKEMAQGRDGSGISVVGEVVGTPRYLAPEQVTGSAPVDIRADLYALGLIMVEMLSGHPARPDGPLHDVLASAVNDAVVYDAPFGSDELHAVLNRLLAQDPADRPGDPAEVRQALEATPEYLAATALTG